MVFNEYMPHLQVTLSWLLIIVELWVNSRKQFVSNTFYGTIVDRRQGTRLNSPKSIYPAFR